MKIAIGITGSSGVVYAMDFLKKSASHKYLVISKWGTVVLKDELGLTAADLTPFVSRQFADTDLAAPLASGSNRLDAVLILPCSISTLGKIASGVGDTLITRMAQVALKERFKLILCIRETPLSTLTLEQCARLSSYGAIIMPISPPLYVAPKTVDEYVGAFSDKVLGILGERTSHGWRDEEL